MKSPAERYRLAKQRPKSSQSTSVTEFIDSLSFSPDDFQQESFNCISIDKSVLVAAPTGSGKTLVAEFGIQHALERNLRVFYTTPIKALSNQKYRDFCSLFGVDNVGLITGDRRINAEAPVIVMTTEILRNMMYEGTNRLNDLGWVVMDEVHYLADRHRGSVWEEVLILLPDHVRLICLSATISNAEEIGSWLVSIRGQMNTVVSDIRPIPLEQMVFQSKNVQPLFLTQNNQKIANPAVISLYNQNRRIKSNRRNFRVSSQEREMLLLELQRMGILPVIYFIFSRNGCDQAAQSIQSHSFTTKEERAEIRELVLDQLQFMKDEDLVALDFESFLESLESGIATHHAGMIPIFREIVETLFQRNLIKIVFATETLALGINMPAKSVVVESLKKFDGSRNQDVTAGEYTQLTGRAGRRGLDDIGYAIVPLTDEVAPTSVSRLASTRTYPLKSSFNPNYNMSLNLIAQYGLQQSLIFVNRSLAHYQANLKVKHLQRKLNEIEIEISKLKVGVDETALSIAEDFIAQSVFAESERKRQMFQRFNEIGRNRDDFAPGSVISINGKLGLVTDLNLAKRRVSVLDERGLIIKMPWDQISSWPKVLGQIRIPKGFHPKDPELVRNLLDQMLHFQDQADLVPDNIRLNKLLDQLESHPFHFLKERESLSKVARRINDLKLEVNTLRSNIDGKTGVFGRKFLSISNTLQEFGYLDDEHNVTALSSVLAAIFIDNDLLLAESIRDDLLEGLSAPELASVLSAFIFESRMRVQLEQVIVPTKNVRRALVSIESVFERIEISERKNNVFLTKPIDAGFALAAYDWVNRTDLQIILEESDLSPGDFVRWIRQLIDLTNQLVNSGVSPELTAACRELSKKLYYGIVMDLEESESLG